MKKHPHPDPLPDREREASLRAGEGFKFSKLVIATHNAGKLGEISTMMAPFNIKAISAGEAGIDEPEETGETFAENALLKARHACEKSSLPSLADDSGLAIPALGGAPGVYSARWAGPGKDFSTAFARIQKELGGKSDVDGYFMCVLALCLPDGSNHLFEGRVDGTLTFPPRGSRGFGYDPIFTPDGYGITFGEMDPAEKNRISHRARAFDKFMEFLENNTTSLRA